MSGSRDRTGGSTSDRVAGALLLLVAALIALESRTFTVGFVTDPLGPKAFPLVSSLLIAFGGGVLLVRPGTGTERSPFGRLPHLLAASAALFAYAMLLGFLGFFATTLLVINVFGLLLGGRPLKSVLSAAGISAVLYLLFFYLLDIALPIGSLFLRSG